MFDPKIMTSHGGREIRLARNAKAPLHCLMDSDSAWQFDNAVALITAMRENYDALKAARAQVR
jgi:hypothetical protein